MDKNILEAKDIYILMKKEYRISRNTRAEWYLKRINTVIKFNRKTDLKEFQGELDIVSALPQEPPEDWDSDSAHEYQYLITERTQLHFLSRKYRLVFCIDFSPSLTQLNLESGKIDLDEIFDRLKQCIKGIVKPFYVPGSQLLLFPKIYVTIIAHTPFIKAHPQQVIVQGWLLMNEKENLHKFLFKIKSKVVELQDQLAKLTSEAYAESSREGNSSSQLENNNANSMVTPDVGFVNMLRYGIIALQLLPENSKAGIIVITDGVISLPQASTFDYLLVLLRNHTISCSFLQVGSSHQFQTGLGYVPFNDLMEFLANATLGAYLDETPELEEDYENRMNDYHEALLIWGFQKRASKTLIITPSFGLNPRQIGCCENSSLVKKMEWSNSLEATLNAVLSCRLREGYSIKNVEQSPGTIKVILVLPWKYCISIEYHIISSWPPQSNVQIEVWIEATYEFLNDVTNNKDVRVGLRRLYRSKMVATYWQTLKELKETDLLLVGLQSFPNDEKNFTLPDCVQKGSTVFYLNSNNVPEPSNKFPVQFANFWMPVSMLNAAKWQKWMHTHRIGVILLHEAPLAKNLHVLDTNSRYGILQSRKSEQALMSFLTKWTDFTLRDYHSYIKFLYKEKEDKTPCSFFLVRMTLRLPCLTIHLAFLGGTSGRVRNEILEELRKEILGITINIRDRSRERRSVGSIAQRNLLKEKSPVSSSSEAPASTHVTTQCCTITHKPIDKILIWHDRKPQNLFTSQVEECPNWFAPRAKSVNQNASKNRALLCRYLHHKRWIWGLENSSLPRISTSALSRILNTLNRMRLNDGFKFAYACNGIVSMVREFNMKLDIHENMDALKGLFDNSDMSSHCVVQYTMFPPHFVNTRDNYESDNEEGENVEADGETQLVTECWIEPQNGEVAEGQANSLWQGLNYTQLHKVFFSADQECIWSLVTFEILSQFCQDSSYNDRQFPSDDRRKPPLKDQPDFIQFIPYSLRLTNLLSRCVRAEILLSTYFQDVYHVLLNKLNFNEKKNDKANSIFYSLLLEQLNRMHNGKQFYLSSHDNEKLPEVLASRVNGNEPSPFDHAKFDSLKSEIPKWRCFIKCSTQSRFLITLVPSSYKDLQLLLVNKSNIMESRENVFKLLTKFESIDELEAKELSASGKHESPSSHHFDSFDCNAFNSKSAAGHQNHQPELLRRNSSSSRHLFSNESPNTDPEYTWVRTRYRYKSGPANSAEGSSQHDCSLELVDSLEPTSRERACSLQNNCRDGEPPKPVKRPSLGAKNKEEELAKKELWTTPEVGTGDKIRKRNVSMPAKAHKEQSQMHRPISTKSVSVEMMKEDRGAVSFMNSCLSGSRNNQDAIPEMFSKQDSNNDPIYGSVVLPIYAFDCRMETIIRQFINRTPREAEVGKDIYINSMFKMDEFYSENEDFTHSDANSPNTTHEASDKYPSPEPLSEESDTGANNTMLRSLVDSIEKCQRRSFVIGVFDALSNNLEVHEFDVQAALDQCQEILLEINISDYLQIICGHLKDFNWKLNIEQKKFQDASAVIQSKKGNLDDSDVAEMLKVSFPLYLLNAHKPCHELQDIHTSIHERFNDVILSQFTAIPNLDNFYYYTPKYYNYMYSNDELKSKYGNLKKREKKKSGTSSFSEDENQDQLEYDDDADTVDYEDEDREKSIEFRSEIGSLRDFKLTSQISQISQMSDLTEDVRTSLSVDESSTTPPLFLHFTATIRHGIHVLTTTSVNTLPTCLGSITHALEVDDLDVSKLTVTLDMLAITLSGGASIPTERIRGDSHCVERARRTISFCSSTSAPHRSSESNNSISDNEDMYVEEEKILKGLPMDQQKAVYDTFEKIKWLVKDEMVSAKLQCYPIEESTLEFICAHVSSADSKHSANCHVENIPLNFVYGIDQSLDHFMKEFANLRIEGYQLEKQGSLYYLTLNKSRSRKRHTSSLVPSLNIASIIARQNSSDGASQGINRESTEDASFHKTSLSSPDTLKSPFKRLQQKVSFEGDFHISKSDEEKSKSVTIVVPENNGEETPKSPIKNVCKFLFAGDGNGIAVGEQQKDILAASLTKTDKESSGEEAHEADKEIVEKVKNEDEKEKKGEDTVKNEEEKSKNEDEKGKRGDDT